MPLATLSSPDRHSERNNGPYPPRDDCEALEGPHPLDPRGIIHERMRSISSSGTAYCESHRLCRAAASRAKRSSAEPTASLTALRSVCYATRLPDAAIRHSCLDNGGKECPNALDSLHAGQHTRLSRPVMATFATTDRLAFPAGKRSSSPFAPRSGLNDRKDKHDSPPPTLPDRCSTVGEQAVMGRPR